MTPLEQAAVAYVEAVRSFCISGATIEVLTETWDALTKLVEQHKEQT